MAPVELTALPTFLVIGAMKAGTTSLHRYLRGHPDVFMCEPKEPEFFSEQANWDRGLDWYSGLFTPGARAIARGEASTGYTRFPRYAACPERIAATLPHVRLLYLLRDPVQRMSSHYRHSVLVGRETRSIDEALVAGGGYLDTSRYATQLRRYLDHVDADQTLVLFSEDLRTSHQATLERACAFIGVDPVRLPASDLHDEHHVSMQRVRIPRALRAAVDSSPVRMVHGRFPGAVRRIARFVGRTGADLPHAPSEETRRRLMEVLADEIDALEQMIGPVPAAWRATGPS